MAIVVSLWFSKLKPTKQGENKPGYLHNLELIKINKEMQNLQAKSETLLKTKSCELMYDNLFNWIKHDGHFNY